MSTIRVSCSARRSTRTNRESEEPRMIVGLPKEIKDNENRVALVPAGGRARASAGHQVVVETHAGEGSGMADEEYKAAGAEILPTADAVFAKADMIVKVKEP